MTYSEEHTISCPLDARYKKLLNAILIKEGARNTPFTTEKGIDLDHYEIDRNRGGINQDRTMDFCIGLTTREMLLVEAKLNVSKPRNIGKAHIENKIRHSAELLREHGLIVAKQKVFLFDKHFVNEARHHIIRILFKNDPNVTANLKVYGVQEFKENCF
jgi:hypothetical protein